MAKVSFDVVGHREVETGIDDLGKRQKAAEDAALIAAAQPVLESIVAKAPIRTGKGKGALKIGKVRTIRGAKYISIGVHKEDYGDGLHMYYQEFGTSRHAARPHIRPGYEEQKAAAFSIVKSMLKEGIGL